MQPWRRRWPATSTCRPSCYSKRNCRTLEKDLSRAAGGYIESVDPYNAEACLGHIRRLVEADAVLFGPHALDAMEQEVPRYTVEDVYEGLRTGQMLENYPEAVRGPCGLINGKTKQGRSVHVVCTTSRMPLFIITVYEPKPPKFVTPSQRGIREGGTSGKEL